MDSLAQQTYAFLTTILAGAVIGLLFDGYRVIRSLLTPKQLATALTDILYWIVVTPTVFAMLLAGNWGELRFYVLLGVGTGLVLYFQTLSPAVIWALTGSLRGVGQVVGSGLHAGTQLVLAPFVFIQSVLRSVGGGFTRRHRSARAPMAWQRFSLARIFGRFSG